jgi:RNA polymerase sigma factor (sigma-70 family)
MHENERAILGRSCQAYGPALVLYARQWLDAALAEDVVQDACVRLLSKWRQPANVKAWLFRCVRNAAIDKWRSRKLQQRYEQLRRGERPWFEPRLDDLLDARTAEEALGRLPEEQREILVLRLWGGLTLQEAAEATDEAVSTLYSRYHAGLKGLRRLLESAHHEQRAARPGT